MVKKEDDASRIFEREFKLLDEIESKEKDPDLPREGLVKALFQMRKEFAKLLKQAVKITRVGDSQQKKLMKMWKLEQEKLRLARIVEERTREIEEKNRQLEEQSEKLKEMDRIKSNFFANISHEFRTPLTLIMGPLEQIRSDYRDDNLRAKADMALRNSEQLLILINQLLDLSRLDSGKMKLEASPQHLGAYLRSILSTFDFLAKQKGIDLQFQPREEDITLYFDPEKMEKIIYNLISNAIKFTPRGGGITVTMQKTLVAADKEGATPKEHVNIIVRDTGIGIETEKLAHIFDRFYQAGDSNSQNRKGTGIGLSLVKELVQLHGAEIQVQSRQGENSGTEFILSFRLGKDHLATEDITEIPIYQPVPEQPGQKQIEKPRLKEIVEDDEQGAFHEEESTQEKQSLVLVVEDNGDLRKYIRNSLEPEFRVEEAGDGGEGIQKARQLIPDLIVSDIMMPGIDGLELCRRLKNDVATSHVPIILLTARAADDNIIQGLETGADDYVTKPFNTKILLKRIKNLVELRRQLQEKIQRDLILQPTEIRVSSIDRDFMTELQTTIDKNISDPEFNVEDLAGRLYMSQSTLYRKIHALTGESPIEFVRSYRLKRAAQLLKANFGNITEVAFETGFSSTAYFTKCFKKKFQQLPSAYQAAEPH